MSINEGPNVPLKVKKIICFNGRFELKFNGLRNNNINALGWIIR